MAVSAIPAEGLWPEARTMRIGIAGLGVATTQVLPGIEEMPHAQIVAAADLRPNALDAFRERYGGRTYTDVHELCADPDVDVVWVNTPNQFHCEHVEMAAA